MVDLMGTHLPYEAGTEPLRLRDTRDQERIAQGAFVAKPRIAQRLSQIGAPVLAIAGDVPPESYPGQVHAALARGIGDVTAVKMPDAGHFPNLEQPDEFHRLVMGFLARAPATAR